MPGSGDGHQKAHSPSQSKVRNVVLYTSAADFAERTAALARGVLSQGPVSAMSGWCWFWISALERGRIATP
jgi:hypothetical protein